MSTDWSDLHRQSERLAADAQACAGKRADEAAELYRRAAEAEEAALEGIGAEKVRTRGIIGVSAAALRLKSGDLDGAEKVARRLLDESALPAFATAELKEILQDVQGLRSQPASRRGAKIFEVLVTSKQRYQVAAATRGAAEELAMQQWARGAHAEESELVAVTTVEAERPPRQRN